MSTSSGGKLFAYSLLIAPTIKQPVHVPYGPHKESERQVEKNVCPATAMAQAQRACERPVFSKLMEEVNPTSDSSWVTDSMPNLHVRLLLWKRFQIVNLLQEMCVCISKVPHTPCFLLALRSFYYNMVVTLTLGKFSREAT